jgi:hypothetical protein
MGIEPTSEGWEDCCFKLQIEYRGAEAINSERERPTRDQPASFFGVQLGSKTPCFVPHNRPNGTIRATESTRLWRKRVGVEPLSESLKPVFSRRCNPHLEPIGTNGTYVLL